MAQANTRVGGKQRTDVRTSAEETHGALLELEAHYQPGSVYPPMHYHPMQDEHFEVLTGTLSVKLGDTTRTYVAGQSFEVPRGTPHTFRNGGDLTASVLWQVRPALHTQQFFETLRGLAADGKTDTNGTPNPLQMAVILREYADEFRLAKPSPVVQTLVFGVLAFIGRLLGYRGRYERYNAGASALPYKPHTAQASVWIDHAPQEVFSYIANHDNDNNWRKVESMTQMPVGDTRVGTITKEVIDFLGQRYVTTARISQFEAGKRLVWESTESAFPLAGWRVVTAENGGTRYTHVVTAELHGIGRLFAPVMVSALRKQQQAELAALKTLMERHRQTTRVTAPREAA